MWRTTCSFLLFGFVLFGVSKQVFARDVSCAIGLGYGYVEISTSVAKPTSFERMLAERDDVAYSRSVHNTSSAHEMSLDCLLSEHVGVRGSYIDGMEFSIVNTVNSPQLSVDTLFGKITLPPLTARVTREVEGSASGLFVYYREPVAPLVSISFEGGFYYLRAKGHWEASVEDADGKQYLALLGETEHQHEYFPSFVLSGNFHFSKNIELVGRYLPVPGKTTKLLFLTLYLNL